MSNKHDLKLDVLSNLDDDIIEKNLLKRFELWHKKGRVILVKRLTPILALAACFCIMFSALFMILLGGKEVPVYTGMTVSTTSPIASAKSDGLFGFFSLEDPRYAMLDNSNKAPNVEDNNGNHNGQNKHTEPPTEESTETPTEAPWDPNASGAKPLFYANKGQDFYITVHIDNPDKFEIMSFTLNGEKYSSYMFEEGSDMENLVLKCNAGDAVGIVEYTIDAIKYVDGTTIKDVKIGGEQTIKVGLYSEEIQPKTTVSNEAISYDSISFSANISDEYDRIADSEGIVSAILYNREALIATQELEIGKDLEIKFESLTPETTYNFVIVALYDSLDGSGKNEYILFEKEIKTEPILIADTVDVSYHTAGLNFVWHELASENSITAIELYLGEEKVRDIDVSATEITDLLANNEYTVKISYTDKGIAYHDEITFKTSEYSAGIRLGEAVSEYHEFVFEINETDEFELGSISAIELYLGEELVKSLEDLTLRRFDELLAGNTYTLKLTYKYNLKDGKGEQTQIESVDVKTQAYTVPTVNFADIAWDITEISFGINVNDPDQIGKIDKIELYLGDTLVKTAASNEVRSFHSLQPLNMYTVKITYLYDMKDGTGEQNIEISYDIPTQNAGLAIENGAITGIGECTDTVLYINMPINDETFYGNTNITEVHIGADTMSIGERAFEDCSSLESVTILEGVTSIGSHAFASCSSLESITIPDGVTYIGSSAFECCSSLESITIPQGVKHIYDWTFNYCESLESVTIPDGVTDIGDYAFKGCSNLKSITIPQGVTHIGTWTFSACSDLKSITIPDGVTDIGDYAFNGCSNLKSITIPQGVTRIGREAFDGCTSLENIIIPDGVTIIGMDAFNSCTSLKSINIPESVTSIGARAFYGSLEGGFVYIPDSVKSIGENAFWHCTLCVENAQKPTRWNNNWADECDVIWNVKE